MSARIADIVARLEQDFPAAWAEPWDRVGLLVGDPDATVRGVRVALDPTRDELHAAIAAGANVLVTHHPAFLDPPQTVTATSGADDVAFRAASAGVALIAAHTNLDRAPEGAMSLPRLLGFGDGTPLEHGMQAVDVVTVYAPVDSVSRLRDVLAEAGAGRIGDYSACTFTSRGEGSFMAGRAAHPHTGAPGQLTTAEESRIEAVTPRGCGARIAALVSEAHPYEEPLITVVEGALARGIARLGRVCDLMAPATLSELVAVVAGRLDCVPRVWGSPDTPIGRVACATGSGGSLIKTAVSRSCHVLIAGEVRYHDALDAVQRGLCVIEAGHDVTEWPLVPVLASAVTSTEGLDVSSVHVASPGRGWWTP